MIEDRGYTIKDIIDTGMVPKAEIEAVLNIGETQNYSIDTFVKVLSMLNVHLELHDLNEKNRFDMMPDNMKPRKN